MSRPCHASVVVRDGDLEKALKLLRNRLAQSGKTRQKLFYLKPSEKRRAQQRKRNGQRPL